MKLFSYSKDENHKPYKEKKFKDDKLESDLENILENTPDFFLENTQILIIGRQVHTNLGSIIDLLGLDDNGNLVLIELKRDKTPRDTIAQILEYASFGENLDYEQLNEIFSKYIDDDEYALEDYFYEFIEKEDLGKVNFNKAQKLVIVAQGISPEIKQTAVYLRKKGIDIYCLEFRYFRNKDNTILASEVAVGKEEYGRPKIQAGSSSKTNKPEFLKALDSNGILFFSEVLKFGGNDKYRITWSKNSFSLYLKIGKKHRIHLLEGYPSNSGQKQRIYFPFHSFYRAIKEKVQNPDDILKSYKNSILKIESIKKSGKNASLPINRRYSEKEIKSYINIINEITDLIEKSVI